MGEAATISSSQPVMKTMYSDADTALAKVWQQHMKRKPKKKKKHG